MIRYSLHHLKPWLHPPLNRLYCSWCNAARIQMLSKPLHDQIFKSIDSNNVEPQTQVSIEKHLKSFGLLDKPTAISPDVDFKLPELHGSNIDEHFRTLAADQTKAYRQKADSIFNLAKLPPRPKKWVFRSGWTKYDPVKRMQRAVPYPDSEGLVFDVEVLVTEGNYPTMATAVSPSAWYSWCSPRLVDEAYHEEQLREREESVIHRGDLIPLDGGTSSQRLIIGHNVGYDRAYVQEQYAMDHLSTRFLDTMSLHIAVSGLTSLQRVLYMAHKSGSRRKEVVEHEKMQKQFKRMPVNDWIEDASLNSLSEVYRLYFPDKPPLDKSTRDYFVKGSMQEIRENFQELMGYCSSDVIATTQVFQAIWPQFQERFPHPVTLAGMLEMGSTYLPVNSDWFQYIESAQEKYRELQKKQQQMLMQAAEDALLQSQGEKYKDDVWLWDLDWTPKKPRAKKPKPGEPVKPVYLEGIPQWYRDLCPREIDIRRGHKPGPTKISTLMRVTPKLLRLVWDGFPVHYDEKHGWGYLVPKSALEREREMSLMEQEENYAPKAKKKIGAPPMHFPLQALIDVVKETKPEWLATLDDENPKVVQEYLDGIHFSTGEEKGEDNQFWNQYSGRERVKNEECYDDVLPGVRFFKLPHKDGKGKKVGNPLAKAFLAKLESGSLRSLYGSEAESILHYSNVCSYWKMNMERIRGQMVVEIDEDNQQTAGFNGVILPKVITAGTVTRRSVEATWLTASNAYTDRIGSELKAMIRSPPGYHFVGADVDSQELWIASLLGDAHFAGVHGSTALGWMMLQGNKKDGTDMHSMTASWVGISRDQAKVFNYGRIYGAGIKFAKQLLMQFNHRLTDDEASSKARIMYAKTKGKKQRLKRTLEQVEDDPDGLDQPIWSGGSESHMFNKLESIAQSNVPKTPVLGCTISKALEPRNVDTDFMASRINWVVQSSAVDYLHLMLVCMRWLFDLYNIKGRFSISIHDEVRYLVASEDRYRAALALQITNLLTRSMFAYKLGMKDLPLSVAFFSAVDLDVCLRKEAHMDCKTPSNPLGLNEGYNVPPGEALTIQEILERSGASLNGEDQPIKQCAKVIN